MMKTKKAQLTSSKRFSGFNCCNPRNDSNLTNLIEMNDYCWPIIVKNDDPCYGNKVKCLNYIKSMKALNNCKLGETAMPINFHTPVIDAELIYHRSSLEHLQTNGGKFAVDDFTILKELLVGYDDRTSQLPGLFLFLKFFVRIHNIIFDELSRVRKEMSVENRSQLARTITTALYQKTFLDMCVNVLRKFRQSKQMTLKT